eukprot:gene19371-9636_t
MVVVGVMLLAFVGRLAAFQNAAIQMDAIGKTLIIDAGAGTTVVVRPTLSLGSIANVETTLSRAVADAEVLEGRVTDVTADLANLVSKVDVRRSSNSNTFDSMQTLIDGKIDATDAAAVTDQLEETLSQFKVDVDDDLKELRDALNKLKTDFEALKNDVANNTVSIAANTGELEDIEKEKAGDVEQVNYFSKSQKEGWSNYRSGRAYIWITKVGKMMHCSFHIEGQSSASDVASFTIPYHAASFNVVDYSSKNAYTYSNVWSDNEAGLIRVASGSKTVRVFRGKLGYKGEIGNGAWTVGNTKIISGSFSLPLA